MRTFILPAILCWLGMLLAYPLAPLAVAFSTPEGRLPRWAWWLETHDNLGFSGPWSEGFPPGRWGLVQWLWRNKAYALRNRFRAHPPTTSAFEERGDPFPARTGASWWYGRIDRWWEFEASFGFYWFRLYFRAGWKMRPYFNGHRPVGPTATGLLIPFSIRTDDFDD